MKRNACLEILISFLLIILFLGIEVGLFFLFSIPILVNNIQLKIYFFIPLIVLLIINYFVIRTLLIIIIYQYQFPTQKFNLHFLKMGNARSLRYIYSKAICVIKDLLNKEIKTISRGDIDNLRFCFLLVEEQLSIYNEVKKVYGKLSSKYQQNYYDNLFLLKNLFDQNDLRTHFYDSNAKEFNGNNCKFKFIYKKEIEEEVIEANDPIIFLQLRQINFYLSCLLNAVEEYLAQDYFILSLGCFKCLLENDSIASVEKIHVEFLKNLEEFNIEEGNIKVGKDKINYCLISNKYQGNNLNTNVNANNTESNLINTDNSNLNILNNNIKDENGEFKKAERLIIICNPNGGPYEFTHQSDIKLYLRNDIDVLCWNYRGYGLSTGTSTFNKCKKDIIALYNEIMKRNQYTKVAVSGYSIGGVAACHLAKNKKIDVLISDRNFADVCNIAKGYRCGTFLSGLTKFFYVPSSNVIKNFIESNCDKIVLTSCCDALISFEGSIKVNLSRFIINNFVGLDNNDKKLCDCCLCCNKKSIYDFKYESILDLVFENNKKDIDTFIDCIINLIRYKKLNSKVLGSFNSSFASVESSSYNEELVVNEGNRLVLHNINLLFKYLKKKTSEEIDYFYTAKLNKTQSALFIKNYFSNLFIWGCTADNAKEFDMSIDIESNNFLNNIDPSEYNTYDTKNNKKILGTFLRVLNDIHDLNAANMKGVKSEYTATTNFDNVQEKTIKDVELLLPLMQKFVDSLDKFYIKNNNLNVNLVENREEEENLKINKVEGDSKNDNSNVGLIDTDLKEEGAEDRYLKFCEELDRITNKLKGNLIRLDIGHSGTMEDINKLKIISYLIDYKFI